MAKDKHYFEKKDACVKALALMPKKGSVGLGSGSTIDLLASIINEKNESKFNCVSKNAAKTLKKRNLAVEKNENADISFDGADEIIKQGGKTIALKGNGALDFTAEKKQDYNAKKFIIVFGKSKLKNKKREIMIEVKKKKAKKILKELRLIGIKTKRILKTDKRMKGKKNEFYYFTAPKGTNYSKLEKTLDSMEGIIGNGIFSKKKFGLVIGEKTEKKTKLQVALDFIEEKDAFKVAEQVKNYVDIIELGTPLIKSIGEHRLIKRAKKYKKEIFADLKTMDAGEYESTPAFKLGAQYAAVLGVSSNETVKGVIKAAKESNGKNAGKKSKAHAKGKEAVVDLISCPDKKKKLLELNKIGAKNFAIHTGLDEQSQGMNPLHELQLCSEVKGVNLFVAGGIKLETIDTVMQYHPRVVIVGGAITRAKSPKEAARALKKRITELEI